MIESLDEINFDEVVSIVARLEGRLVMSSEKALPIDGLAADLGCAPHVLETLAITFPSLLPIRRGGVDMLALA